ncbi:MAG TPA: phospholipase D-like domain-containing protein [Methylomirabilota bacterium]|nr:phospholipase D-like domain-containing protein [Methylomirabilota bacterium]
MIKRRFALAGVVVAAVVALALAAASCDRLPPAETLPSVAAGDPAFAATMEAHTNSPVVGGNRIDVLLNGDQIFPAKLAVIRSAQTSITYAEYFYADGGPARDIAEALAERCRAGVAAHILLDGFGTLSMPREYVKLLETAGCHVATFRPLGRWVTVGRHNKRNHRRVLVADGRVAVTGGSGVSEKWTGDGRIEGHWRDTDVRIEGPAVRNIQSAFFENWREATGELLGGERYLSNGRASGEARVQVIKSSPAGGYDMYTMYLLAIGGARRSVYLTNPYFLPDDRMEEALLAAAARGVRVVALTPGKIDHNVVRAASRHGFGRLLLGGIEIYEYQAALLHAKTMIVDGVWATVGSTNFDNRSFALNDELNVVLYDRAAVARLVSAFQSDVASARRVTYDAWQHRGLKTKLLERLVLPIQSQL